MKYTVNIFASGNSREVYMFDIENYEYEELSNGRVVYYFSDFDGIIKYTIALGSDSTILISAA